MCRANTFAMDESELLIPQGNLMTHVVAFVHLLRSTGTKVSVEQTIDLVRALEYVPMVSRNDFSRRRQVHAGLSA